MTFFYWAEKQTKLINHKWKKAQKEGKAYLGHTILSMMLDGRETKVKEDLFDLLSPAAAEDPDKWGSLWEHVDEELMFSVFFGRFCGIEPRECQKRIPCEISSYLDRFSSKLDELDMV